MIVLNELELSRGAKVLFSGANLTLYDKQKIGIVGKNGCGKTSLFMLLQGVLEPDDGVLSFSEHLKIVTVDQEIPRGTSSALEYVIDADIKLRKYQQELMQAETAQDGVRIAELYESLRDVDGFTAESRAAKILAGLGFLEAEMMSTVNALSGGWRMRLNLARALFIPSNVLLLDEPTNHLDIDAVMWLEKWLKQYPGLLLYISHDRDFLDKVADHIVHIENKSLTLYTGNYSGFEKQRIAVLAQQQQQYVKQQQQREHIESYINRFRYKASKAKQAQSRLKALARMQEIMPAHVDSPFSFEFKEPKSTANPLLMLQDVSFSYETDKVLDQVDFQLNTQDRIALLGRNGAGKSTLIKLLARELTPSAGRVEGNGKIQIGYFAQHTLDRLDGDKNVLQNLQGVAKNASQQELRKFLGGFAFSGDISLMQVNKLSGGEKARLALALIVWQAPNVLLLDEPTNHLDLDMRQALVLALQNYNGAVVLVSHDRFLLDQVVDNYWLIASKKVQHFSDDLDSYQNYLFKADSANKPIKKAKKPVNQKKIAALERKIEKVQQQISRIEEKIAEVSSKSSADFAEIEKLSSERNLLIQQCEKLEAEWLSLA